MSYLFAPLEALTDPLLTDPERRVLLALFSFKSRNADEVWPSSDALSERSGVRDKSRLSKLLGSLVRKGWINKERKGWSGRNRYELLYPGRLKPGSKEVVE